MSRRTPRRRSSNPGDLRKHLLGGALAVLALGVLAAGAYVYTTAARPPTLDRASLCPVDGPRSVTVVLLDSTDDIPDDRQARDQDRAGGHGGDAAHPRIAGDQAARSARCRAAGRSSARCNPGDGTGLSEYTANPRLARKRWLDGFREPLEAALESGLHPSPGKTSPIMETIQRIAVERFTGRAAKRFRNRSSSSPTCCSTGRIIRNTAATSRIDRFKASRAYKKVQTDLHGAEVMIYYIQRQTGKPINSTDHIQFWAEWIRDNNGRLKQASKLQGVG